MINNKSLFSLKDKLVRYLNSISNECITCDDFMTNMFKILSNINGYKNSSFYLLNNIDFDFELKNVDPISYENYAKELFEYLISQKDFSKIFTNENLIEFVDEKFGKIYVFPLKNNSQLNALFIINLENNYVLNHENKKEVELFLTFFNTIYTIKFNNSPQDEIKLKEQIISFQETIKNLYKIFNSIGEGLILTDVNNIIADANKAAINLLGVSRDEMIGKNIIDFLLFFDKNIFKNEIINNEEAILVKNDGTPIPIIYKNHKITLDNIIYNMITINDITDRKLMEDKILEAKFELENKVKLRTQELNQINIKLKEEILKKEIAQNEILKYQSELIKAKEKVEISLKAKTILLNKISHEFRTPLVSILGFSEMLENEIEDAEQKEMIIGIKEGGKRLLNSLDSVLLLSELESSEVKINLKKINIVPIIKNVINLFENVALSKSIKLYSEIYKDEFYLNIDEDYFKVIVHNLIDNAIKFTKKGEVKIIVNDVDVVNKVKVSICDTGIGIDNNELENLFEDFKQSSEGLNRNYEGFGLGLTIVKKMTELMNGQVEVKSKLNQGSTFSIIFEKVSNKHSSY